MNHHVRYVMLAIPFLQLLAARGCAPLPSSASHRGASDPPDEQGLLGASELRSERSQASRRSRRRLIPSSGQYVGPALVVVAAVECLATTPHQLSYFNLAFGGLRDGWRTLGASNVDWGQDSDAAVDWIVAQPEKLPLRCDFAVPLGEHRTDVPLGSPTGYLLTDGDEPWPPPAAGWYAVTTSRLPSYRQFRDRTPTRQIGGSIRIYRIDPPLK
jgi:hypothetical protein